MLGALGAILTLVTAVMFYFGWRRSEAQSRVMGIDVSLFGFSTEDYVLRSISSLYLPLLVIFSSSLFWLWLHARVVRLLHSDLFAVRRRRAAASASMAAVAAAGVMLAVSSVLFLLLVRTTSPPEPITWAAIRLRDIEWAVPLLLALATLTAGYATWIRRQLHPTPLDMSVPPSQPLLAAVLIAGIVMLSAFWMLEEYAVAVGHAYAQQIASGVDGLASAAVLSPTPLGIDAPGVSEERIGPVGSPGVRYRTTGLRLLARSGGKVLLVHNGWEPETGTVVVLPDSEEFGWQFSKAVR